MNRRELIEGEYYRSTVYMPEPSLKRSPLEEMFSSTKKLENALLAVYMLDGIIMFSRLAGIDIFTALNYVQRFAMLSPSEILKRYPQIYYGTFIFFFIMYTLYPLYHVFEKYRRRTELVVVNPAIETVLYTLFLVSNIMLLIITKDLTLIPILIIILLGGAFMFNKNVEVMVERINREAGVSK